jgi:hypothetical protein
MDGIALEKESGKVRRETHRTATGTVALPKVKHTICDYAGLTPDLRT